MITEHFKRKVAMVIGAVVLCVSLQTPGYSYEEVMPDKLSAPMNTPVAVALASVSSPVVEVPEVVLTPEPTPVPTPEPTPVIPEVHVSTYEAEMLARLAWGEARGIKSYAEKSAVMWVALNRTLDPRWSSDLRTVLTQRGQFYYSDSFPVQDDLYQVALHVLEQYELEKMGYEADRSIPKDYFFYTGDGKHNHFRKEYYSKGRWDWSLPDPYVNFEF